MLVTLDNLVALGACRADRAKFLNTFGQSVDVTYDNLVKAYAAKIDVGWWAERVFGKAYNEAVAGPRKAYNEAVAGAWKAYEEACARAIVSLVPHDV